MFNADTQDALLRLVTVIERGAERLSLERVENVRGLVDAVENGSLVALAGHAIALGEADDVAEVISAASNDDDRALMRLSLDMAVRAQPGERKRRQSQPAPSAFQARVVGE